MTCTCDLETVNSLDELCEECRERYEEMLDLDFERSRDEEAIYALLNNDFISPY